MIMTETEFTERLNTLLLSCGISQGKRGYWSFIRISYRFYKNSNMKMENEGVKTNYRLFYKLLASLRIRGKYNEYIKLLYGK